MAQWRSIAATLLAGFAGAALAALAGVPAGALIGGTLAVAAAAGLGLRMSLPDRLRDLAFATIGVSLGSGVDERLVSQIGTWSVSLAVLILSLLATVAAGRLVLSRGFGLDPQTATLATAPGTMSNVVAITLEGHGDTTAVMVLQLMRLLALVILVPPLAVALDASAEGAVPALAPMALPPLALLLAGAILLGALGRRAGLPAASLLAGMVLSAAGHATGLVHGVAPPWLIFAAFAVTGSVLGARLSRVTPAQARTFALAGLATIAVTLAVSLGFAGLARALTGLPFGQVWIAYAPGGVEAMAAIGLSLGYDPAYVAVHHFARIFAFLFIVPLALRL